MINILRIIFLFGLIISCADNKKEMNTYNSGMDTLFYADGKPISIKIKDGKIEKLIRNSVKDVETAGAIYVAPGLIDHQVNGYLSHSFVGDDLDTEKVMIIIKGFWEKGITTFMPTLTTESNEVLLRNFTILNKILEDEQIAQTIPGFHLEGPYISPVDGFRGAHNLKYIRKPDWQEFEAWYHASGDRIIQVTVSPEIEGTMDFIKKCIDKNMKVSLGHTNASAEQIHQAVELGATISTHLGNGCANTIHRHHNPIWPQLSDDGLYASIIVDGFHLTKDEVRTFYKVKGPEKTILVSDITRWAGMPPGNYSDFDQEIVVTKEGAIMMPAQNVLAGASFMITRGIENVIKFTGCSLEDAINMSTRNPAKALGLNDRGEIEVGKRADLVYFKFDSGKFEVVKTIVGGKEVYAKPD